jgi:hypothetical protein
MSPREYAIPPQLFKKALRYAGFEIVRLTPLDCSAALRLAQKLGLKELYDSRLIVRLDIMVSSLLIWNMHYHARNTLQKIVPYSHFVLASKI